MNGKMLVLELASLLLVVMLSSCVRSSGYGSADAAVAATVAAARATEVAAKATEIALVQPTAASPAPTPLPITQYDWIKRNPPSSPPDMGNYGLTFDGNRNVFVLFGGGGETWEWNGNSWTKIQVSVAPSQRGSPAIAYDSRRNVIVLFGGLDEQGNLHNDTWEYDGKGWGRIEVNGAPAPRRESCIAYDETRGIVVLFGGDDARGTFYNDTWTYDGYSWVQHQPAKSPSPRSLCGMAYDSRRAAVVLFGGAGSIGEGLDDTWEWDGSNWTEQTSAIHPPARGGHALVYHNKLGVSLSFGGDRGHCTVLYDDTWAWDGAVWQRLSTSSPGTHSVIASAYDPLRNSVLLFGGWAGGDAICRVTSETWEFVQDPTSPQPAASNAQQIVFTVKDAKFTYLRIEGTNQEGRWTTWKTKPNGDVTLVLTENYWWQGTVVLVFDVVNVGRRSCVIDYLREAQDSTMATIVYTEGRGCTGEGGSAASAGSKQVLIEYMTGQDASQIVDAADFAYNARGCVQGIARGFAGSMWGKAMVIKDCAGASLSVINEVLKKYNLYVTVK